MGEAGPHVIQRQARSLFESPPDRPVGGEDIDAGGLPTAEEASSTRSSPNAPPSRPTAASFPTPSAARHAPGSHRAPG
jgi:hypothetical protein